jgi:predicted Zn-dependent peptidase
MFKRIVRPDGSVLLLVPKKETQAITFEVIYKVGSRQENLQNNGVSHFVEHLMFKGTQKRPNTIDISKELDGIGAEYNAFTSKEHTGYYITADASHLPLAMDMLSDMLYNSKFDAQEMDRERGVIVEEINMYEDNPSFYVEEIFEELLFQGSTLGKPIAGPREVIKNIGRQSLYQYYKKNYYNGNAVIGVAGNFSEAKMQTLLKKYFPVVKRQARNKIKKVSRFVQNQPRIKLINRNLEQVQLIVGFRTMPSTDKRFIALQILGNILGGTMSSRLFLQIREHMGLCYFIKAEVSGYEDASSFAVHSGLNKDKIYEALSAIKEELDRIKRDGVSQDELQKAKDNIRGRLILRLESPTSYLNFLAAQELLNKKIKDRQMTLDELEKITVSQINILAKEVIDWQKSNLAIIGPFESANKFLKILNKN